MSIERLLELDTDWMDDSVVLPLVSFKPENRYPGLGESGVHYHLIRMALCRELIFSEPEVKVCGYLRSYK